MPICIVRVINEKTNEEIVRAPFDFKEDENINDVKNRLNFIENQMFRNRNPINLKFDAQEVLAHFNTREQNFSM